MLRFLGAAILVLHMAASASAATVASAAIQLNLRISGADHRQGLGTGRAWGSNNSSGASSLTENTHDISWSAEEFSMTTAVLSGVELPGSQSWNYATATGEYAWDILPSPDYWRTHKFLPASTLTFEISYDVMAEALTDGDPNEYSHAIFNLKISTTFWAAAYPSLQGTETIITGRVLSGQPDVRRQASIVQTVEVPAIVRNQPEVDQLAFRMTAYAYVASTATIIDPVAPVPLPGSLPLASSASVALLLLYLLRRRASVRCAS